MRVTGNVKSGWGKFSLKHSTEIKDLVYSCVGCRQHTSAGGLNVEVQKVMKLHQGPKIAQRIELHKKNT